MKRKGCGKERHYSGISLEGLRKTKKNVPVRISNGCPDYILLSFKMSVTEVVRKFNACLETGNINCLHNR
jgi:hypothetical protein